MPDDASPQAVEAEGVKEKKKVNGATSTVSARLGPQDYEAFLAGASALNLDRSAVAKRLLVWWVNNGCRFPDERDNVAVVQTSITSGAPSVVVEAIVEAVTERVEAKVIKHLVGVVDAVGSLRAELAAMP